ncbi:hypothetical protein ABIA33_004991 [Streptacidiphilus sp. MAP12-16]
MLRPWWSHPPWEQRLDLGTLDAVWDDIIAELDSDWGAYTYVAHIGLGA